jgi:hypothetical protein
MTQLSYTLLSDGSSDRMLMPAIDWLLGLHAEPLFEGSWADLRKLPRPPKLLGERMAVATELFPCELLFVYRDAEAAPRNARIDEIEKAIATGIDTPCVPVVPVRMQEAWFLFDESAIRAAAGNEAGELDLALPMLKNAERLPNPKSVLDMALRTASELTGRRLSKMNVGQAKHRLATLISDFSQLREPSAFGAFEDYLKSVLMANGWAKAA